MFCVLCFRTKEYNSPVELKIKTEPHHQEEDHLNSNLEQTEEVFQFLLLLILLESTTGQKKIHLEKA